MAPLTMVAMARRAKEVRWAYDQESKRFIGDDGDYVYWRVEEGDHAGEYAYTIGLNRNVFYESSQDEVRKEADRHKRFAI
jgi:hypothetical protein